MEGSSGNVGMASVPVLPLVDRYEDSPCMDLPDIGDPPFANEDDGGSEAPSSKMQRLLEHDNFDMRHR